MGKIPKGCEIVRLFEIGEEAGLEQDRLDRFVNFFITRFKPPYDDYYAMEWAHRFLKGEEESYMDEKSKQAYKEVVEKKQETLRRMIT